MSFGKSAVLTLSFLASVGSAGSRLFFCPFAEAMSRCGLLGVGGVIAIITRYVLIPALFGTGRRRAVLDSYELSAVFDGGLESIRSLPATGGYLRACRDPSGNTTFSSQARRSRRARTMNCLGT